MATKIIYYTDTPQDTAFRDKLYDAASERVTTCRNDRRRV